MGEAISLYPLLRMTAQARHRRVIVETVLQRVGAALGVDPASLVGGGRAPVLSRAGEGIACPWTAVLGRPGRALTAPLGIRPQSIYAAAARDHATRAQWDRVLEKLL